MTHYRFYKFILFIMVLGLWLPNSSPVQAHPLGNFTINRYSQLVPTHDQITIHYLVDMAEVPTFNEMQTIDMNNDQTMSEAEADHYLSEISARLGDNLSLTINGEVVPLTIDQKDISIQTGEGDLPILLLTFEYTAPLPSAEAWQVTYEDNNYQERIGWLEVIVKPTEMVDLLGSTAPNEDISNGLQDYPDDLSANPFMTSARFNFVPIETTIASSEIAEKQSEIIQETPSVNRSLLGDGIIPQITASWITDHINTPFGLLIAIMLAFGWGGAHALTPGHGKTVVAAYLVGSRGTMRHAILLGLTTTLTHTLGVFALGIITLFLSRFILPEQLYPWLGAISGLLVVTIGFSMLRDQWQGLNSSHHHHHHHHHHHSHHHHHHDDDHSHHHHHHHMPPDEAITWRSLLALGVSGGLVPCPSALILMLVAIGLNQVGVGLVLVVIFSVGLAAVLTTIGILFVHARRWLEHLAHHSSTVASKAHLWRFLPMASAFFIMMIGLRITVEALLQIRQF